MVEKRRALDILEDLKARIALLAKMSRGGQATFLLWLHSFETAIVQIFPDENRHLSKFKELTFVHTTKGMPNPDESAVAIGLDRAEALLQAMINEVRDYWTEDGTSVNPHGRVARPHLQQKTSADPRVVFVVHGRNGPIMDSMFAFLTAINLKPLEWSEARELTEDPNPYIGHVLEKAFATAQAFIVVMTPDDEAQLKEIFHKDEDPDYERVLTGQARPNVLFEAGMAMGQDPKRTVLVEVGKLRPFSDIVGRHTVKLDNTVAKRQELAQRLKTAGCAVNMTGTQWHKAGNFKPDVARVSANAAASENARDPNINRWSVAFLDIVTTLKIEIQRGEIPSDWHHKYERAMPILGRTIISIPSVIHPDKRSEITEIVKKLLAMKDEEVVSNVDRVVEILSDLERCANDL